MKVDRKTFIKSAGSLGLGVLFSKTLVEKSINNPDGILPVCTLVPAETLGPFPSLPSGDAMYWRSSIGDSQPGVVYSFTIRVNGVGNCGVLQNARVDVWHCNADGYYSHYAATGANSGHMAGNAPNDNANLIYGRGSQVTNANGEVTFTSIFPGWYPGRTWHIHFAVYTGGTAGSASGWTLNRISQFTVPITEKNVVLTSNAPYSTWGADPLSPNSDNVFSTPSGEWALYQHASLSGSGSGPFSSFYEVAVSGNGVLPLTLIGFNGSAQGQSTVLWWKTASEINFSHFEIECGADGEDFEYIGQAKSKGNNNDGTNEYIFEDESKLVYGNAFYRLKIVDLDGSFVYSATVVIRNYFDLPLRIHPNPVEEFLVLQHGLSDGTEQVMVVDSTGKPIGIGAIVENVTFTSIDVRMCKPGLHFLVFERQGNSQSIKFMKI